MMSAAIDSAQVVGPQSQPSCRLGLSARPTAPRPPAVPCWLPQRTPRPGPLRRA